MNLDLDLLPHQAEFVEDITSPNLALVGGYGCGKTFSAAAKLITLACHNYGHELIGLSPTYGMANKVLVPAIEECLYTQRIPFKFHKADLYFDLDIARKRTRLHIMAAETYKRAAGINAAAFLIDELDLIDPEVARAAWQMLTSRLRKGRVYQGCATTTPEGFKFAYQFFVEEVLQDKDLAAKRRIIKASTYDNPFLPASYIEGLLQQYPENLIRAYLEGEFVNLVSGSVYPDYDPDLNHTNLTVDTLPDNVKTLHIGMDFNVENPVTHPYGIYGAVAVVVNGRPYVIDEIKGCSRTSDVIKLIKSKYPDKKICVYPDATSSGDRTSAAESDREQLRMAGFTDLSPLGNPKVKDRVNAVNALILNGKDERRLLVNKNTCPVLSSCLIKQPYDPKTGAPQKDTGFDDPVDALGYFVNVNWPVKDKSMSMHSLPI